VDGRDRRLQLVGAHRPGRQGGLQQPDTLGDGCPVPQRPVLVGQRHQRAVGAGAGGPTGVGEQHQRQQPGHLAGRGQVPVQLAGQVDRLVGQGQVGQAAPGAGGVALGEDQVEHVGDGGDPAGQLLGRGQGEPGPGLPEPGLGPDDPLGHGGLWDQEGPGDLGRAEPGDGP
jgi:hypothetical protein